MVYFQSLIWFNFTQTIWVLSNGENRKMNGDWYTFTRIPIYIIMHNVTHPYIQILLWRNIHQGVKGIFPQSSGNVNYFTFCFGSYVLCNVSIIINIPSLMCVCVCNFHSWSAFMLYMYLTGLEDHLESHFSLLFLNVLALINPLLTFLPIIVTPLCLFFQLCLIKVDLWLPKTDTSQLNTLP